MQSNREYLISKYGIDEKDIVRDKAECEAAKYDWEWFDTIAGYLTSHPYRFAKTMAGIPHMYTLRKTWDVDAHFEDAVVYMRMVGHHEWFYGKKYVVFNVNQWKHWTMFERLNKDGKPLTILINKTLIDSDRTAHYNFFAENYDRFSAEEATPEQVATVMQYVDYKPGEKILDVGCGTGRFLDWHAGVNKADYLGVDKSYGMLAELFKKHGAVNTVRCNFEDFYNPGRFDKVIALFGSFSYIPTRYAEKVIHYLKPGGKAVLMFYGENYRPQTYQLADIEIPRYKIDAECLRGWDVQKMGNYMVALYEK